MEGREPSGRTSSSGRVLQDESYVRIDLLNDLLDRPTANLSFLAPLSRHSSPFLLLLLKDLENLVLPLLAVRDVRLDGARSVRHDRSVTWVECKWEQ